MSESTIFGGFSGLHRSVKSVNDTEHGALGKHLPELFRATNFSSPFCPFAGGGGGGEFDPTLDRVGGRRTSGCNSLALPAVDTTDANVAQVQALCLVQSVELQFLVDSSPSIDYRKAKDSIGSSRTVSLAFLQLYEVRLTRCDDPPCPLYSCPEKDFDFVANGDGRSVSGEGERATKIPDTELPDSASHQLCSFGFAIFVARTVSTSILGTLLNLDFGHRGSPNPGSKASNFVEYLLTAPDGDMAQVVTFVHSCLRQKRIRAQDAVNLWAAVLQACLAAVTSNTKVSIVLSIK
jgi:hypothetical protein